MSRAGAATSHFDIAIVRGRGGRAQVARLSQEFPQRITAPMYLDPRDPGAAFICLQNPTAGVFPADRLVTSVDVGPGATLHVTYQAATQIFAGDTASSQHLHFHVWAGASLLHTARVAIPHRGSRHTQYTKVEVEAGAVYLGWDAMCAGRVGRGESFAFDSFRASTSIYRSGVLHVQDTLALRPGSSEAGSIRAGTGDPATAGRFGENRYLGTLFAVADTTPPADLAAALTEVLRATPDVTGAASLLPDGVGVVARVLSVTAPALERARLRLWETAHGHLFDRQPSTPRI